MNDLKEFFSQQILYNISPYVYKKFWFKKFYFNPQNLLPEFFQKHRYLEKELILLPIIFQNIKSFFDIGSNLGVYLFWAEKYELKTVYSFEPIPYLFRRLKKIFSSFTVEQYALSNQQGKVKLYVPIQSQKELHTRASLQESFSIKTKIYDVEAIPLDTYCQMKQIAPDFIKIDVEGHEQQVIEGAYQTLKEYKPLCIVEIEKQHNPNYEFIFNIFDKLGYKTYYLDENLKLINFENIDALQRPENYATIKYINNFLFMQQNHLKIFSNLFV